MKIMHEIRIKLIEVTFFLTDEIHRKMVWDFPTQGHTSL